MPWEVKAARHEYRVAAPCRRYCDAVGLLTRGTRIEVELCARSGPCWKVAESRVTVGASGLGWGEGAAAWALKCWLRCHVLQGRMVALSKWQSLGRDALFDSIKWQTAPY